MKSLLREKLLLLSSILLVSAVSIVGCKAKKTQSSNEKDLIEDRGTVENIGDKDSTTYNVKTVPVYTPGTIDQEKLDSIKAVRKREKRQYKK